MTDFYSMIKSRDITLSINVHIVKAMTFPVHMYGSKNWTIKKVNTEKQLFSNYGAVENSPEPLREQEDQIIPS